MFCRGARQQSSEPQVRGGRAPPARPPSPACMHPTLGRPRSYYAHFKMAIAPGEGRPRDILSAMVPAAVIDPSSTGPMSGRLVVDLFADLLSFIRTEALDRLGKQTGSSIADEKICWVLTVPAIWDDAAKVFMRHAALKAVRAGWGGVG